MKLRILIVTLAAVTGLSVLVALSQAAPAAAPAPSGPGAAAAGGPYTVDTSHTSVIYRIRHNDVAYFYGRFNDITGSIDYDSASPAKGSVSLTIKTQSVDTKNTRRDDDLRSPSFFNAAQFPEIVFNSTAIRKVADDTFDVTGNLSLRGVTKLLTLRVKQTGSRTNQQGRPLVGFETTFTLKRSDYGITWMLDAGLGDEVTIMVGIEARR